MNALRARRPLIACLLVGALAGAGVTWLIARSADDGTTARLHQGATILVSGPGNVVSLVEPGEPRGSTYVIAGADWEDCSSGTCGPTHDGTTLPECLPPLSSGEHVEILVVTAPVSDTEGAPEYSVNRGVFVRCLSKPAHLDSPPG